MIEVYSERDQQASNLLKPAYGSGGTITERLADHIVGLRYEDIPPSVVRKAKDHLVNHLGNALRLSGTQSGQRAAELAVELSGGTAAGTIIGSPHRADILEAVFANSFLMGGGRDDTHPASGVHPGVIIQPAAWTVGEAIHASGRDLLTAVIAAYDVMTRLCRMEWIWKLEVPRRPNSIVGPFGSAAVTARLLGLSHTQTVHALGHAGQAGMGVYEGIEGQEPIHALLARNGSMAAMLARAGMAASPTIIEGRYGVLRSFFHDIPDSLEHGMGTLGEEFEIANAMTKPYRASSSNIPAIGLMIELMNTHALEPGRIADVDVAVAEERRRREAVREAALLSPNANSTSRSGSLRFQLAVVVADGGRNEARFEQPPDADLQAVLEMVRLRFESALPARGARIEVTTIEGERYAAEADSHDSPPIDWTSWLAEGGRAILSQERVARLAELITYLEDVPEVAEVMTCAVPEESS